MGSMTVGTHRDFLVALLDILTVYTAEVLVLHSTMTSPARVRRVDPGGRARRILVALDVVRSVTTHAVCRDQKTFFADCVPVDRIHVGRIDVLQPILLRQSLAGMAGTAGLRNIQRIDRRSDR